MKLKDCEIGKLVQDDNGRIGHIIGLTYNVRIEDTGKMPIEELNRRTIPLVQFPNGSWGVHPENLKLFKG